jgi:hypothetical protein
MIDLLVTFGAVADSQDCLPFLERRPVGFGRLRLRQRSGEVSGQRAPWRSL